MNRELRIEREITTTECEHGYIELPDTWAEMDEQSRQDYIDAELCELKSDIVDVVDSSPWRYEVRS